MLLGTKLDIEVAVDYMIKCANLALFFAIAGMLGMLIIKQEDKRVCNENKDKIYSKTVFIMIIATIVTAITRIWLFIEYGR